MQVVLHMPGISRLVALAGHQLVSRWQVASASICWVTGMHYSFASGLQHGVICLNTAVMLQSSVCDDSACKLTIII